MQRAAGIIIVRRFEGEARVLCLRSYGSYDFPKGHLESDETELEAALRETSEEVSITDVNFPWGMESYRVTKPGRGTKVVTLFLGVSNDEPVIVKNPVTNRFEHHGFAWLPLDEAQSRLHEYLRPAIDWVRQKMGC